jgi:hypothetical protein
VTVETDEQFYEEVTVNLDRLAAFEAGESTPTSHFRATTT